MADIDFDQAHYLLRRSQALAGDLQALLGQPDDLEVVDVPADPKTIALRHLAGALHKQIEMGLVLLPPKPPVPGYNICTTCGRELA